MLMMMKVLIKIICLLAYLPNIKSDCVLKYSNDTDIGPKFEKIVGKFNFPVKRDSRLNSVNLAENERIQGFCETYFSPITYRSYYYDHFQGEYSFTKRTEIVLKCKTGVLYYNTEKLSNQTFSCTEQSYNIYSTTQPYSWCKNNLNSSTFLFVTEMGSEKNVLAGICYSIDQISLQTLVYNTTNVRRIHLNPSKDAKRTDTIPNEYLDENLLNFKNSIASDLSEENLQTKLTEMGKTEQWLNIANYEVSSIVQDEELVKAFNGYENILNIIWWRNLRVGNWKRFHDTLTNYANNNSYELYLGSSGLVKYPTYDKYYKEKYLEIKLALKNESVPAYIWTYLKSNDNLNKEFIMIGYNSPYAEHYTTEEIIFCPDICSEIPWLKEISVTFSYATAGIMFCCSTEFIRQTNYLQGFPLEILSSTEMLTTVESTTNMDNGF